MIGEGGAGQSTTFSPDQGFSPNTFGTLFGIDLTEVTLSWGTAFVDGVAPTSLGGVRVFYNGEPAFISFVQKGSDFNLNFDQINFVVPDTDALGPVSIEVETASGRSAPVMVMNQALSPTFFSLGPFDRVPQVLRAVHLDGAFVGPADLFGPGVNIRPAKPGDIILLFGTGFGQTSPPVPVGTLPGQVLAPVISPTVEDVRICFGDVEVVPSYAGLSSNVALYQINVTVPDVPPGDVLVVAKVAGLQSQDGISINVAAP